MSFFEGKVVWITGASSGIGEALAYTFAKYKAKLILSARRKDELERVKNACNLPDADILLLTLDVAEIEKMEEYTAIVLALFGRIDILVNNAGLSHWSKIKDTRMDVIKRIMDVNFLGGVALSKAVLPNMIINKQGQIVVISSILGKIITAKQSAYTASKHAIMGFYDTLRAETWSEGIKVLIVCPGFVRTNVAKNSLNRDGQPINKDNPKIVSGLDPIEVSERILRAIRSGKEEIVLAGFKERFAIVLKRFAPALFSKFISKTKLA
ncbi:MAG: SDR family oxidoreductase [Saprospiraceae bacterium]